MAHRFINRTQNRASQSPGVVLLVVLWMAYFLGVVILLYVELGMKKMRESAMVHSSEDLRTVAYSALDVALAAVNEFKEIDGAIYGPQQGWADPLEYTKIEFSEDLKVSVSLFDETSKIPLLSEDPKLLMAMYDAMDLDTIDAQTLVHSLADWMDADDKKRISGAEESDYKFEDPPVLPPNQPITSYSELRYVKGFKDIFFDEETGEPNELFHKLRNYTSLHHTLPVNVNTAQSDVIEALYENLPPGVDNALYEIRGSDGELGTADDRFVRQNASSDGLLGNTVGVLRVEVTARRGAAAFKLTALVQISQGSNTQGTRQIRELRNRRNSRTSSRTNQAPQYPFSIVRLLENDTLE